jgi:leucyl/phenylalanyl-tRNA--protein transferase
MPIFQLSDDLVFPHPSFAEDGVLAIGGDLSPDRILLAYQNGIFPWYNEGEPIIWHSPNPRFVLFPKNFYLSKSLKRLIKQKKYSFSINKDFKNVIKNCKQIERKFQNGTWITNDMEKAYILLNDLGFVLSVEIWNTKNKLVGGLYGIIMGKVFFGESMFHLESNTSKLAFYHLIQSFDLEIIDCQVYTEHLESLGAEDISLDKFLIHLQKHIN